jgi:hypothetical protein
VKSYHQKNFLQVTKYFAITYSSETFQGVVACNQKAAHGQRSRQKQTVQSNEDGF